MKRIQLFEFEDFPWFPSTLRSTMTKIIVVLHKLMGTKETIANILTEARSKTPFSRIVDMGSGSGGAMPMVVDHLNETQSEKPVELLLTDLHPNPKFVAQFNAEGRPKQHYAEQSFDATQLNDSPEGIKTMVNSFHHMPPPVARNILQSAQENKQAFLIYEIAENNIPLLLWWLLLPLSLAIVAIMAIVFVPFVKPLHWKDLLFTWPIPIVPICYAWDGQASLPRMYTFDDIKELLPEENPDYIWEMGQGKKDNGKKQGYYILGYPKN